jgi:predicted nucleic acid-binding protein
MRLVVADAGPLHYLVLTGDIILLPKLFESVLTPKMVCDELSDSATPALVRAWIADPPSWLEIRPNPLESDRFRGAELDAGEAAAIALALEANADLILLDDREGVAFARAEGLAVTGTLGVLDIAARRGLVDLAEAFARLKRTSFYYRQGLLDAILNEHRKIRP